MSVYIRGIGDDMGEGTIATIVAMGAVYWLAYGLAVALAVAVIGMFVLAIVALVAVLVYLAAIGKAVARKDVPGIRMLTLTPVLMTAGSLLVAVLWCKGVGPGTFINLVLSMQGPHGEDPAGAGAVVIFICGLVTLFGWVPPLYFAWLAGTERSPSPAREVSTYTLAIVWGVLGGSVLAVATILGTW